MKREEQGKGNRNGPCPSPRRTEAGTAGPLSGLRLPTITAEDLSIEKEAAGVKANLVLHLTRGRYVKSAAFVQKVRVTTGEVCTSWGKIESRPSGTMPRKRKPVAMAAR